MSRAAPLVPRCACGRQLALGLAIAERLGQLAGRRLAMGGSPGR